MGLAAAMAAALTDERCRDAGVGSSPATVLHGYRKLFPELVEYRGGWFRADSSRDIIDQWFAHPDASVAAVERVCSHVHVLEDNLFGDAQDGVASGQSPEVALALAQALAFSWKAWARARYGLTLQTFIEPNEDDQGVFDYIVSFQSEPAA